jgi:amino acid adenylation domain-containing protein
VIEDTASAARCPLTPMQIGMLHDSVLAGRPGLNVEQVVCHFPGVAVDPGRLAQAWADLARLHPVLRSVCVWRNTEQPHLCILDRVQVHMKSEDLSVHAGSGRRDALHRWLRADRERGVDIDRAPHWRLALLRWADRDFSLVWTFHHLFLDGPSFADLLQQALQDGLGGHGGEGPKALTHPCPSLLDHALALERLRADPDACAAARTFFAGQLNDLQILPAEHWPEAFSHLPGESADRSAGETGPSAMQQIRLCRQDLDKLDQLCQQAGSSVAIAVQVAWGLALSRWTGQADVVFGVVRSGRYVLPASQKTLGCLINTLPVRLKLRHGLRLGPLLHDQRQDMLAMRSFEHVAMVDVQQWCGLDSVSDLFTSTVLFEPRPLHRRMREAGFGHLEFELHERGASPLSLMAYADDGLDLQLEHDPALMGQTQAHRLLESVHGVLVSMANGSHQSAVAGLGACKPAELHALATWHMPEQPVKGVVASVVDAFEERVRILPDKVALSTADGLVSLTYAELDRAANRMAHWLKSLEVGVGERVAICLSRGPDFVIAALAVMKSGAAWVPVDPGYPPELVEFMLGDSQSCLVLTSQADRPAIGYGRVFSIEELQATLVTMPDTVPGGGHPMDRAAYVIYTSGSTGRPKGVLVGHRALASHARAVIADYGLGEQDRVLQFASLSFDVSIEEIIPTLLAGAELVLRDAAVAESVADLFRLCSNRQLTVLNLPTAYWHTCVEQMVLSGARLTSAVRLVIVGGEKASRHLLERWLDMQAGLRWINAYGPTEATISCTRFEASHLSDLPDGTDVPIGRPFGHARVAVLAADGSLAPPGAPGELCIGGPCLAMGYLGLPQVTAERFVTTVHDLDPALSAWGLDPVYRTGDEVRWDTAGLLRFRGRHDRQVKVRGFRVELRAVESALEDLPGVSQALVRAERAGEPDARLLAWVLPQPGVTLTEQGLTELLSHSLPAHLRPDIQLVSAWPTTAGGKIDVRRLPAHHRRTRDSVADAELGADVQQMMALFARTLQTDTVGPDDSFFDLGGHSLLAVRLIGHIEQILRERVTSVQLKQHPTPRRLAGLLGNGGHRSLPDFLIPIQATGNRIPIYAVHGLGQNEVLYRGLSECLGQDQPFFGLTVGYDLVLRHQHGIEELAGIYREEIESHRPHGPVVLMGVSHSGYVAYELARQLQASGRDLLLVLLDTEGPLGRPLHRGVLPRALGRLRWARSIGWSSATRKVIDKLLLRARAAIGTGDSGTIPKPDWMYEEGIDEQDILFIERLDQAVSKYRPGNLDGRVINFLPAQDFRTDPVRATETGLGWAPYCSRGVQLIEAPGGHVTMLAPPHVQELARRLRHALDQL